jgi:acyl transferase domain-containing protein/acyl carrier protein
MEDQVDTEKLRAFLVDWICARLGTGPTDIDFDSPFTACGLTSVDLAALAESASLVVGRAVPVSALFEHPTPGEFIRFMVAESAAAPAPAWPTAPGAGRERGEPLAIVGIGCRIPGASDPQAFWELLRRGGDAVREVPRSRWDAERYWSAEPGVPGRTVSKWGGYLDDIEQFDPGAFGISMTEADRMDPQQRLLLEVCWEALEDAGWRLEDLRRSATGVFVGISANEYGRRLADDQAGIDGTMATGNALSVAANRLSYVFDLRGPSVAVDSACSSSLVAMHLAIRAVRDGDCERAIVAGVNALLDPEMSIALSNAGMLAPDGRCKAFDAAADGYVRSEGCVAMAIAPLPVAREGGDRVYALLRGSAVNSDGKSNGLTAPNPAAQEEVLRAAYANAGVEPAAVGYVECHGTGTALGDPLEITALSRVVGRAADGPRCLIGSVKSNIGHLEAAAGLTGLLKAVLAIYYGEIPPTIHVTTPNPALPLQGTRLALATTPTGWPAPRYAGVSSFGFGGTNAHVVLGGDPVDRGERAAQPQAGGQALALPLSARSPAALTALAGKWADWLETTAADTASIAHAAALRRSHHVHRLAVTGRTAGDLASELRRSRADRAGRSPRSPRVAFVFSGQGHQFPGMARVLSADPLFASILRRCDEAMAGLGPAVSGVLAHGGPAELARTEHAQPALFALQSGLAAVLRAHGIEPAATIGHSVGEIAAAQVAGRITVADGIRIAVLRGQAMAAAKGAGRMLATSLTEPEAEDLCACTRQVYIAAANGSQQTVLAGGAAALEEVRASLKQAGRSAIWLSGDYPFHSPLLAADFGALRSADLQVREQGSVRWYSTVTGRPADDLAPDGPYWERNAREPVRFANALAALVDDGIDAFVELGPHPALLDVIRQALRAVGQADVPLLAPLHRDGDDQAGLLRTLCALYERGCDIRWGRSWPDPPRMVSVPGYAWEHRPCWIERPHTRRPLPGGTTLLGERIHLAVGSTAVWECELGTRTSPFLAGHRVAGAAVLPGSGYLELAIAAAQQLCAGGEIQVRDLTFRRALPLEQARLVQVCLAPATGDEFAFTVHSRPADAGDWTEHATGRVRAADTAAPWATLPAAASDEVPAAAFYQAMLGNGLDYGPSFRRLRGIRRGDGVAVAQVTEEHGRGVGPASADCAEVLDACFQLVAAAISNPARSDQGAWLFVGVREVRVSPTCQETASGPWQARVQRLTERPGSVEADAQLLDADGTVLAEMHGIQVRQAQAVAVPADRAVAEPVWLYVPAWRAAGPPSGEPPGDGSGRSKLTSRELVGDERPMGLTPRGWLLLADQIGVADRLAGMLDRLPDRCVVVRAGSGYVWNSHREITIDPSRPEDYQRLLAELPGMREGIRYAAVELRGVGSVAGEPLRPEPAEATLTLIQALSAQPGASVTELAVVTVGAQAVHDPGEVRAPAGAALWGLVKALPFENPVLSCRCIDIDSDGGDAALLAELRSPASAEAEVAIRQGKRFVRRIVRAREPSATSLPVSSSGGYVITGGLGDLGLVVARWLVGRGARGVALIGRSAPSPAAERVLAELRGTAEVLVLSADVARREPLEAALDKVRAAFGSIRGAVHAAAILQDAPMLSMPAATVRSVFAPKAQGAWLLHECCIADELDWFACFSSAAAVIGSPGQANYCAANAAMDALAQYRRGLGMHAITINWGPWADVGMAARLSHDERSLRTAVGTIDPDLGAAILERLLAEDWTQVMVLGYDLRHLVQYHPGGPGLSMFDELVGTEDELLPGAGSGSRVARRPDLPQPYRRPSNDLEKRIAVLWHNVLGVDTVGVDDSFFELGGDSVLGNQVLVQINRTFGITVDARQAFASFTVATLAALVEQEMIKHLEALTEEEARDHIA